MRTASSRILLVIAALVMAATACNLQRQSDNDAAQTPSLNVQRPSVVILEPNEGATVTRGQSVSVKANATGASGVTLVELRVNNVVVDSQVPAESLNPTSLEVLLDYTPEQAGMTVLSVTAYSNAVAGPAATRTINVIASGTVTLTPGVGAPTATQYNPICRARIDTGLNFRRGPGVEYDILATFGAGQEPPIIGYADRADGRWWQISWGGQVGWIKQSYTTQLGDCSAIRPAVVPASPTPSPTKTSPATQANVTPTYTLPDLMLSVLDGPHQIDLGTSSTAQAVYVILVRNNGGQSSGQFNVGVSLPNGATEDLGVIANLGSGQEVQIPAGGLTVTFNSPGIKRLLVTVDTKNNVTESSESNNQAYLDITVTGGAVATVEATIEGDPGSTSGDPVDSGREEYSGEDFAEEPAATTESASVDSSVDAEIEAEIEAGPVEESGQPIILQPLDVSNVGQAAEIALLQGHAGTIDGLAFDPAATRLASASWDGTIRVWDAVTGAGLVTLTGHVDRVVDVAFSPDGSRVASGSWDGTARLWDINTGMESASFPLGAEVNGVSISPDGSRIAAGGQNPDGGGLVRVWDVASGAEIIAIPTPAIVNDVQIRSNGQIVIATQTGDCDPATSGVGLWDMSSGTLVTALNATGPVSALAVTANDSIIAGSGTDACSGNGSVWVWNGADGTLLYTFDHSGVEAVAFGPGAILASSGGGAIQLWNANDGQPIGSVPGSGGATGIAFSSDGTLVASGGADGNVRLWGAS